MSSLIDGRIGRFAYRYFASHDEAMEITQKTFIKAYKKLNTLEDTEKFSAWLYCIANMTKIRKV